MRNTKVLFIINVIAFVISVLVIVSLLFQNVLLCLFSFMKAVDGNSFDTKDLFALLRSVLSIVAPQSVFFYTFFRIEKANRIIAFGEPISKSAKRHLVISTVFAAISGNLLFIYLMSMVPILIWGFRVLG